EPPAFALPRLDFPPFDGTNVVSWVRRVEKYFEVINVEEVRKVKFDAIYFTEDAEVWFYGHLERQEVNYWPELREVVLARFDDAFQKSIVGELHRLT
ncbi:hypothetical protein Droror1_Dr00027069, partial [Drosera rotundifolia]